MDRQQIDESPAAATPNVKGMAFLLDESNGSLVLFNPIIAGEISAIPKTRNLIVALGDFLGAHGYLRPSYQVYGSISGRVSRFALRSHEKKPREISLRRQDFVKDINPQTLPTRRGS
jgi:hypothetical protein